MSGISYNIDSEESIYYHGFTSMNITYFFSDEQSETYYCNEINLIRNNVSDDFIEITLLIQAIPPCGNPIPQEKLDKLEKIEVNLYSRNKVTLKIIVLHKNYSKHLIVDEYILRVKLSILIYKDQGGNTNYYSELKFSRVNWTQKQEFILYKSDYISNNIWSYYNNRFLERWDYDKNNRRLYTFSFSDLSLNNRRDIFYINHQDRIFSYENYNYIINRNVVDNNIGYLYGYTNKNKNINKMFRLSSFISNTPFMLTKANTYNGLFSNFCRVNTVEFSLNNYTKVQVLLHEALWIIHNRDGTDYPNSILNYSFDSPTKPNVDRAVHITSGFMNTKPKTFTKAEMIQTPFGFNYIGETSALEFITPFINYKVETFYSNKDRKHKLRLIFNYYEPIISEYPEYELSANFYKLKRGVLELPLLYTEGTSDNPSMENPNYLSVLGLDYDKILVIHFSKQPVIVQDKILSYYIVVPEFDRMSAYKVNNKFYVSEDLTNRLDFLVGIGGGYFILSEYANDENENITNIGVWYKILDENVRYKYLDVF